MQHVRTIGDIEQTWAEREALRFALCKALMAAELSDALTIAATFLDDHSAGMPDLAPFADIRTDADFWADLANPVEVEAYFAAALKRLGRMAQGLAARKRLFVCLWQSFPIADRQAFLARVDAEGQFTRGAP